MDALNLALKIFEGERKRYGQRYILDDSRVTGGR
jgi:hypothetical protein